MLTGRKLSAKAMDDIWMEGGWMMGGSGKGSQLMCLPVQRAPRESRRAVPWWCSAPLYHALDEAMRVVEFWD